MNREESVPAEVLDAMEYDLTRNDESEVTVGTAPDFGSDTQSLNDTVDGRSDVDGSVEATPVEPFAVEEVDERVPDVRISPAIREAMVTLDRIHLPDVFRRRATVLRAPPKLFRGAYCAVLRLVMNEVRAGRREFNVLKQERGWKLFLLIPRLLLHRPARGGLIPRRKLRERFEKFVQGHWVELQVAFAAMEDAAQTRRSRVSRTRSDTVGHRTARAESLAHLGHLSAARTALEGAPCAPGGGITLRGLQDERRRPQRARVPIPQEVMDHRPEVDPSIDRDWFLVSLRTARRGAAGGPSGMTAEHLRVLLHHERDSDLLYEMALDIVRADIPEAVLEAIRLGRMTALQKPGGGVRGIVVGDILRRLVAKTLAQEMSHHIEAATSPFQYALTTRCGCECIAHAAQALTDADPEATVLSIDGIGRSDFSCRDVDSIEGRSRVRQSSAIRAAILRAPVELHLGG